MNDHMVSHYLWAWDRLTFRKAFISIGHTANAVRSDMKQFLEPIMAQIKQGLQTRG